MFSNMLHRKKFSMRRNATKRWKQALGGGGGGDHEETPNENKNLLKEPKAKLPASRSFTEEPLSVVIRGTSMNEDQQKQAVEIANMALDTCYIESEIATFIKLKMDSLTGQSWHVIVGRNFGSHVTWEQYIQFSASKITILLYQIG